jgi:hypothetical protein
MTDDVDRQISCRTVRIVADAAQLCTLVCSYSVGTNPSRHIGVCILYKPVAEFLDPEWGITDKVNSGIGLSYRPARLHGLACRDDNLILELTLSSSQGSMNSARG